MTKITLAALAVCVLLPAGQAAAATPRDSILAEFLAQAIFHGFCVGDIPIPTRYSPEAFSINFRRSLKYGIQCIGVIIKYFLHKTRVFNFTIFCPDTDNYKSKCVES